MTYTDAGIASLWAEYRTIEPAKNELIETFLQRGFNNERAKEFAVQGFCRRVKTLARCIQNTYEMLPPELTDVPDSGDRMDVEISLHAFVMNIFGALDNLAWVWVEETGVRQRFPRLRNSDVGLRPQNVVVYQTLTNDLKDKIGELRDWIQNLESFRHSLAHRIPLYVPPFAVNDNDHDCWQELERAKAAALLAGDLEEHERVRQQQLERDHFYRNRGGFPMSCEYDSHCMPEAEAGMHGTTLF